LQSVHDAWTKCGAAFEGLQTTALGAHSRRRWVLALEKRALPAVGNLKLLGFNSVEVLKDVVVDVFKFWVFLGLLKDY